MFIIIPIWIKLKVFVENGIRFIYSDRKVKGDEYEKVKFINEDFYRPRVGDHFGFFHQSI